MLLSDASISGLGVILAHQIGKKENPIAYFSRSLSKAEKNYSVTELECLGIIFGIRKCHTYIYGRHFTIVTDHHALTWLQSLKEGNRRLINWSLYLQNYHFSVIYKRGKIHSNVDALSRAPASGYDTNITEGDLGELILFYEIDAKIIAEQTNDKDIEQLKRCIVENPAKYRDFKMEDKILLHYEHRKFSTYRQVVLPKSMLKRVLQEYHDDPFSGHLGVFKTYEKVRQRYWIPNLKNMVKSYIKTCRSCQILKSTNAKAAGMMGFLERGKSAFDVISIDTAGPLPRSKKLNEYLLVITCRLTKYVIIKPVRQHTAQTVANFILKDIILVHGPPRLLISDSGTEFVNKVIASLLTTLGVIHRRTPAYHPMANGQTECYNRTWKTIVSAYVNKQGSDWDEFAYFAQYAYNSSTHETIGISPYFALYMREPKIFDDINMNLGEVNMSMIEKLKIYKDMKQYLNERIEKAHRISKNHFDKFQRLVDFSVGDQVLRHRPVVDKQLGKSFTPRYEGPFTVTKKLGNVTYEIKNDHDNSRWSSMKVHVKSLRPYHRRDDIVADKDVAITKEVGAPVGIRVDIGENQIPDTDNVRAGNVEMGANLNQHTSHSNDYTIDWVPVESNQLEESTTQSRTVNNQEQPVSDCAENVTGEAPRRSGRVRFEVKRLGYND
ncbi:Transposon Ty3-G Gag-Pol polyprotein [Halotydeus destructor]|nr:Transposon Ty3-G Gag-Pol polyprotein [Halotydeus destructor]